MKVEQLPSGSYRVQKMIDGKRHSLTYDHEPKQKELERDIASLRNRIHTDKKLTFRKGAESYIDMKRNVLSPRTVKEYTENIGRFSDHFLNLKIDDITQADIQLEINKLAKDRAPKTVRNYHGFISSVIKTFRPDMVIRTTLPQKVKYVPKTPSQEDVKELLEMVKGTRYEIPFRLGCLGLRRSEVCALSKDDLKGNILTINKALVQNKDRQFIIKVTKTTDSAREIYVTDELAELIRNTGDRVYEGHPGKILQKLHKCQDKLSLERFRLHDLRHFYASYAHQKGMSDADIMASGGWKTDNVMKNVYRHAVEVSKTKMQKKIADSIF